jgi:hypothetical protein
VEWWSRSRAASPGRAGNCGTGKPGWYDILHLTGHADVSAEVGPHLLLETDTGLLDRVDAER